MKVSRYAGSAEDWDRFVRSHPEGTHCHLFGWKRVIEACFGHRCIYLAAEQDGALAGVLPLVWVRSRLFGKYLVSMPFLNYGGPIGTPDAVRALAAEAMAEAARLGADLLELRCRSPQPLELPASHRKVMVLLDLPAAPDKLMGAFPAKLRSQIRRPQKEGVEVRFGADQIAPFYKVFAAHMRDLGTPVLPFRLFQSLADNFPASVQFACAWHEGNAIACGAGFTFRDEFEITWASALRTHNRIAPNMLVYFSLMERCVREGTQVFNFGRSTPGSGPHKFKAQWGGRDLPLWWYAQQRAGIAATPSPTDEAYSWGPRLWKKLPLPVASALGPFLSRSIP